MDKNTIKTGLIIFSKKTKKNQKKGQQDGDFDRNDNLLPKGPFSSRKQVSFGLFPSMLQTKD